MLKIKPNSIEYKPRIEKRAQGLAELEKQWLSSNFNSETGEKFYEYFELDLKPFIEKLTK